MWHDLVIIHRPSKQPFATIAEDAVLWSTCLRQLLFLPNVSALTKQELLSSDQILQQEDAYRLALEICCGLHSPILGETEVFGQFRDFFLKLPNTDAFRKFLRNFAEQAIADTKQVRQEQLLNLGAQSYGSLLRRHCSQSKSLAILGAGQLTEEILPWFSSKDIMVVCRQQSQGLELQKQFSHITVHDFSENLPSVDTLMVAAPIPAEQFEKWFRTQSPPQELLVDLRGEATQDPLCLSGNFRVLPLQELFQSIERQRSAQEQRANQAKEQIAKRSQRLWNALQTRAEHRPFGWEDMCC